LQGAPALPADLSQHHRRISSADPRGVLASRRARPYNARQDGRGKAAAQMGQGRAARRAGRDERVQAGARGASGFSLLEMMVALAVFAIAALALINLQGASLAQTAELDSRLYSEIVARNLAVDALTDPRVPALGKAQGTIDNGGRTFTWRRTVSKQPDSDLLRIDLIVAQPRGVGVSLTVLRAVTP